MWTASGFDKKSVQEVARVASHAGVFREEIRAPLKTPAWEAIARAAGKYFIYGNHNMLAFILASLWYLS